MPAAALAAVGAPGRADGPGAPEAPEARLVAHLRPWRALLLLDNCEHVLEAAARLADAVLRGCPGVRVLATSRELLGVAGETAWRVPSLGLPDPDAAPGAAALEASGAGRLFLERARAAQPAFALTDANAGAVAEVCVRLDGIPLALELAAARVRVLTPEQLAARLGDRFRLLTGGGRTALRRQQTLRATVDWSPRPARASRSGRCSGAWPSSPGARRGASPWRRPRPSAPGEPAGGGRGPGPPRGAGGQVAGARRGPRGRGALPAAGDAAPVRRGAAAAGGGGRRRARPPRRLVPGPGARHRRRGGGRRAPRRNPARGRLLDERESVRAALGWWAADPAAAPAGLELLAAVGEMGVGETQSESRRWLETFLGLAPARTAARARCLLALDHFLRWEHEFPRALAAAREAREIFEALGDEDGAAEAASHEGLVAANLGDYDRGAALLGAALARARARGDWARVEQHARDLGVVALAAAGLRRGPGAHRGEPRGGRAPRRRGPLVATGLLRLAVLDRLEGDLPRARARLEELRQHVVRLAEAAGAGRPGGRTCWRWSGAAWPGPRGATTRRGPTSTARCGASTGAARGPCCAPPCAWPAWLEVARGAPARGVTLLGAGADGEGLIGTVHVPEVRAEAPGFLERARQTLGEAAYAAAWAEGQAMTLEQAVAYALEEDRGDG